MKHPICITWLLSAVLLCEALPAWAQKKLVPASVSAFSGISLPQGSLQDNRLLSKASAAVLLEDESTKAGVKVSEAEVLQLPGKSSGWSRSRFEELIRLAGWQLVPATSPNYGWLKRGNEYLIYYYEEKAQQTDLYFGKPEGIPAVSLPATTTVTPTTPAEPQTTTTNTGGITGTWLKTSATSSSSAYGYIKCQYNFFDDGTFVFYKKTFDAYTPQIIFRKETGSWKLTGNTLSITPTRAVVQTWSKKDNADQYGSLIKAQTVTPEVTTYTVRFVEFSELNLLLSPVDGKTTERDGMFGINSQFPNTYFYQRPPNASYLPELPPGEVSNNNTQRSPENTKPSSTSNQASTGSQTSAPTNKGTFTGTYTYNKTNWDDGWVSTIEEDKVVVTKGNIRVHLYYPLPFDDAARNAGRDYFWDNYLTKEFRILSKQYRDHGEVISALQAPYIEGTAIDPKTGRNCFLAFYVGASNGIMFPTLAIAPDEQSIRTTFPKAEDKYHSDLAAMSRYNRFAVALPDIVGKWHESSNAAMNYYNAYTGAYAGMAFAASSDEFEFFANGQYVSKHQGASGMVGNMNTYSLSYAGKATVTNWEIVLTNRHNNKTETFHAWFEAVKGGRVLYLQNKEYSGNRYLLVRELK
ncbi:hypothetical protein FHS56_000938 [Thermonema lapsum]|uniref:Uncharacterized protein n=1 Tax=Thermonema lapsum TaxID=28195 RepID=A0A846MQ00_9BACT|nr:hypothetical protein [Thermonema lapsum]NIK73452.1 hypothetical protein [Thermonema lapsum]